MPMSPRVVLLALLAAVATVAPSSAAVAGKRPVTTTAPEGWDVSYPQCGAALPSSAPLAIVGVDGGRVFSGNSCLATELSWAGRSASTHYYVNTGNPGPRVSTHWPSGQTSPQLCATTYPDNDSTTCAYNYGWNAAADSWSRAVAAAASAGVASPVGATWWLDVETGNSWEALQYGGTPLYQASDLAALQGERDYLLSQGAGSVGVYSTSYQWSQIVGSASFGGAPAWVAGVSSHANAQSHCTATSFTGGRVALAQFAQNGYDADLRC